MRIGIDISQTAYSGTGAETFVKYLIEAMIKQDNENEYILFYSSLRKNFPIANFKFQVENQKSKSKITLKKFKFPPTLLDFLWNRLHICPIEWFIGDIDIFITSDWTEPPVKKAKKMTIIYDLIVYRHPEETDKKIIATQKRKLFWVVKESEKILCISEASKKDAMEILHIPESKLAVIYPGL